MDFGTITGPESSEEFRFLVDLGKEQFLRQVSATEAEVFYEGHEPAFAIQAVPAHDAVGSSVPTTLAQTGPDEVTLTVHHREGNPAAGGAPFVYPIISGTGWPGGFHTVTVPMENPLGEPGKGGEAGPPPSGPAPVPTCKVPALRGDSLRGAKARLRAAHCGVGAVRLAAGATAGKGKVVKQFHPAGTELTAGAPIAVKLAAR
jgi:hypothetical protein